MGSTTLPLVWKIYPSWPSFFLTEEGEEQLIGLSLVLPMGWKQPPPLFTTGTETVADLTKPKLHSK
jgi:hypothetical protein